MLFKKIRGLFSNDLSIDLGTANTLIYVKGQGIVLDEPSVVAIRRDRSGSLKSIAAVGREAKQMLGRTPKSIEAIRPMKDGVIADFFVTEKMLQYFIKQVHSGNFMRPSPRVLICVPAGATQVERRAIKESAMGAGAREVYLIEEPMASAIGVGINIFEPEGSMIVDIGGGTSELAVVSLGGVVKKSSFRVAGDRFDMAIVDYVRQKHNLLIGEKSAEDIKIKIGTVDPEAEELQIEVSGKYVLNGLPKDITLTSSELIETLSALVQEIIEEIRVIFEKTPPELAADIKKKGIYISGGGALLRGIDKKISSGLNLKVTVAEDPLNAVINGIGVLLNDFSTYSRVLVSTETEY